MSEGLPQARASRKLNYINLDTDSIINIWLHQLEKSQHVASFRPQPCLAYVSPSLSRPGHNCQTTSKYGASIYFAHSQYIRLSGCL